MICSICGKRDCINHGGYNALPDELIEAVFGVQEDYAEELSALPEKPLNLKAHNSYGHIFYEPPFGTMALFKDQQYRVNIIDSRLLTLGVQYIVNGKPIAPTDKTASAFSEDDLGNVTLRAENSYTAVKHNNVTTQLNTDEVELNGVVVKEEEVLTLVYRISGGNTVDENVIASLFKYLQTKYLSGTREEMEVNLVYKLFKNRLILADTAALLILSYFPKASGKGVPLVATKNVVFVEKTPEELFKYMHTAACNLYPELKLFNQYLDLMKPVPVNGERRLIHILAWNVFRVAASDERIAQAIDYYATEGKE